MKKTEPIVHLFVCLDQITAELSVRPINGSDLASTSFTFFDCSSYSSCTQCVTSPFPCDFCIEAHRCTHDTAENCRNDILVTGVNVSISTRKFTKFKMKSNQLVTLTLCNLQKIGPSYRSGPSFCPTINAVDNENAIFIASGSKRRAIRVKAHIIGQFIVQTRFICRFIIEGRVESVNAQLLADTIYCDAMEFEYKSNSPTSIATFDVIWGGSKPLDNPDNIHGNSLEHFSLFAF